MVASVRAGSSSLADRVTASLNLHGAAEGYFISVFQFRTSVRAALGSCVE